MLRNASRLHLLRPSYVAAAVTSVLTGEPLTHEATVAELQWAATYEDDVHWCERMRRA